MTSSSTKGDEGQGGGASGKPDRAVVNGAGQAVSALRASVPSALPCLKCGAALHGFDERYNHPMRGVEFTSGGHYGTAVFDPLDGSRIAINICDPCLMAARSEGAVGHYTGGVRWAGLERYGIWKPPAQAMSASGQDPQGLGAKPASAVAKPCAQTPPESPHHDK